MSVESCIKTKGHVVSKHGWDPNLESWRLHLFSIGHDMLY